MLFSAYEKTDDVGNNDFKSGGGEAPANRYIVDEMVYDASPDEQNDGKHCKNCNEVL